jgi:hypothetical protein
LASADLYDKNLKAGGQKKIMMTVDGGEAITRHFGMQLYTATVLRKIELEGPKGVDPAYLANKKKLINAWLDAAEKNYLEQGWFVYKKE